VLGLVVKYVGKEKTLNFTYIWIWQTCVVLLLVYVYKYLNPSDACEKVPNFTLHNIQNTNLYDLMETNEEMTL